MGKIFFTLFLSAFTTCFLLPAQINVPVVRPIDTVYYYIKADTASVDIGYLRVDSIETKRVLADHAKGDYALWKFKQKTNYTPSDFFIINKVTQDTLKFDVPAADAMAAILPGGDLDAWYDLFDERNMPDVFLSYSSGKERHYLTCHSDGTVRVSKATSALTRIQFRIERPRLTPDANEYYRIKVDTAGMPDVLSIGYLRADIVKATQDSLAVDTVTNDLSLWQFAVDTIVSDTAYFRITNKETDKLLAFDIPANDTIATVKETGKLNQWRIPFFAEEKGIGALMARDTSAHADYYLGLTTDSVVMLIRDHTVAVKRLSFVLGDRYETPPLTYRFDSTQVYKVRYKSGPDAEMYMGVDIRGASVLLDSVYAHVPDGQYVVNRTNTTGLLNRTQTERVTDTLYYLVDSTSVPGVKDTIPDMYIYRGDTVEVKPINYGSFDKTNPVVGYKYFSPSDLSVFCYYFSYTPADTLNGRLLGADATVKLLAEGDTATYLIEEAGVLSGAPAVGSIVSLKRYGYRMRSMADTTLYLSAGSPSAMTDDASAAGIFSFKEADRTFGEYYIVPEPYDHKFIVDSISKQLIHADVDTSAYSYFRIVQTDRPPTEEPDPYTYLTEFPDSKGKGFYEFRAVADPPDPLQQKWLTKNYSDYAVLGKEGESMLRAGSYTPYDLQLWLDTARGPAFNPDKPSFYIVKGVDTTVADFDDFKISGYFLHVIDAASLVSDDEPSTTPPTTYGENPSSPAISNDNYVVTVDGEVYNRANFIHAARSSANELRLGSEDVIGEPSINEYRFYMQETDEAGKYYIVTEAGYGVGRRRPTTYAGSADVGGRTYARGYLSVNENNVTYFGPRDGAFKVSVRSSTVSNEVIPPPLTEEINREVTIMGGAGQVVILNAAGQSAMVFNILGQQIAKKELTSDHEYIPVSRGILIVKAGTKIQKVVVK